MSTVHIVGAGLAGLSAAVTLAGQGRKICIWEGAGHAGGRCRSFEDSVTGRRIDNGNHLLLSANHDALHFLDKLGARDSLIVGDAVFPFMDVESGERWCVRPGGMGSPFWLFDRTRNVPGIRPISYLRLLLLAFPILGAFAFHKAVGDYIDPQSLLAKRFLDPFTVAVLNTDMREADAALTFKSLLLSFGRGQKECRPMMARLGLSETFIDPALEFLKRAGIEITFNNRLRAIELENNRVSALDFVQGRQALSAGDQVILAVPAISAKMLLPQLKTPEETAPIVNVHIRMEEKISLPGDAPIMGIVGGTAQWFMVRDGVLSATISAAHDVAEWTNEEIAEKVWADARRAFALPDLAKPSIRVIKERRATFRQNAVEVARRPGPRTQWRNLFLAGDWTNTGLPATIDGAIRSGGRAAHILLETTARKS